mmetsp:Transcript_12489/g.17073  ORF Transcript_12489/g.17073 Transcript_12489/m.17073 type:complete len:93 (+) Transcript_12489:392-670(+)
MLLISFLSTLLRPLPISSNNIISTWHLVVGCHSTSPPPLPSRFQVSFASSTPTTAPVWSRQAIFRTMLSKFHRSHLPTSACDHMAFRWSHSI